MTTEWKPTMAVTLDRTEYPVNPPLPVAVVGAFFPVAQGIDILRRGAGSGTSAVELWRAAFQSAAIAWDVNALRVGPRDLVDGSLDLEAQCVERSGQFGLRWSAFLHRVGQYYHPKLRILNCAEEDRRYVHLVEAPGLEIEVEPLRAMV